MFREDKIATHKRDQWTDIITMNNLLSRRGRLCLIKRERATLRFHATCKYRKQTKIGHKTRIHVRG